MENNKIRTIIDNMEQYTVAEVMALVKALEKEFDVSAQPQIIEMAPAVKPKTEFDVELTDFGKQKVKVIKLIREITGLGLKEAKDMVGEAPVVFMKEVTQERADEVKAKLEEAGAVITLK